MKRPQKVTREDRLSQYARKMYEKEKIGKQWEEELPEDKKKNGKKIRTILNRRLRSNVVSTQSLFRDIMFLYNS